MDATVCTSLPLVSVLMAVYKEPLIWVQEAIDSILSQTYSDFEFIIVNDNPVSEELKKLLLDFSHKDKRIKIITNSENIGLTKSLNIGLEHCRGRYIARMDADDISLPTRFEKQVKILSDNPNVGIVGSWVKSFGSRGGIVRFPYEDEYIRFNQLYSSPFDHPATMMSRIILDKLDYMYDVTIRYAQDQDLWYRMGKISRFVNIQEVLYRHRYNHNQISCKHISEQQYNVKIIRRKLVRDFFKQYEIKEPDYTNLSYNYIENLRKNIRHIDLTTSEKKYFNTIVKSMYFSMRNYSISNLLQDLLRGNFFYKNWTFKDFMKIIIKHIRPKSFVTLGLI